MQEQVNNAMESAKEAAASVTERVSDFFQGNPFATPVGRKIGDVIVIFAALHITYGNWAT